MERVVQKPADTLQIATELQHSEEEWTPVLISGAPVFDEGQLSEVIYVFSDLRQIREVERMRDDFFHNIIHELRTPLATILMYARLLREGKARDDPPKTDRFLGVIERESDRLQRMVRQMLQMSKLTSREIQRSSEMVDLNALFAELLPPLADRAVEKGLTFSQRIPSDLPEVMGNEETLQMVFRNLLDNAIKFTMSGAVSIRVETVAGGVQITVSDEGIGIPEESLPNLYRRFFRTRLAVERGIAGTGLGLYMVKEGVEKHNGSLKVSSTVGKGTVFTVFLPRSSPLTEA
jgi:two-component system phosphate regulon sensor histidine kinase PhoR